MIAILVRESSEMEDGLVIRWKMNEGYKMTQQFQMTEPLYGSHRGVRTKATYVTVDVLNDEKDTRNNGGGMTPDRMEKKYSSTNCQHIGYAEHIKFALLQMQNPNI
ncbi:hypothetical protein Tco_0392638 [Tanacetum coccineum]